MPRIGIMGRQDSGQAGFVGDDKVWALILGVGVWGHDG